MNHLISYVCSTLWIHHNPQGKRQQVINLLCILHHHHNTTHLSIFLSNVVGIARPEVDLYPEPLRAEIDQVNARVYSGFNNGVYRAGFATTQQGYEKAIQDVTETLDWLNDRLSNQPFLVGDRVTEADVRLYPTAIRYDAIYTR